MGKTPHSLVMTLSESALQSAAVELNERANTGILPDGIVRELAREISDKFGISVHLALTVAENAIMQRIMCLWADLSFKE